MLVGPPMRARRAFAATDGGWAGLWFWRVSDSLCLCAIKIERGEGGKRQALGLFGGAGEGAQKKKEKDGRGGSAAKNRRGAKA